MYGKMDDKKNFHKPILAVEELDDAGVCFLLFFSEFSLHDSGVDQNARVLLPTISDSSR